MMVVTRVGVPTSRENCGRTGQDPTPAGPARLGFTQAPSRVLAGASLPTTAPQVPLTQASLRAGASGCPNACTTTPSPSPLTWPPWPDLQAPLASSWVAQPSPAPPRGKMWVPGSADCPHRNASAVHPHDHPGPHPPAMPRQIRHLGKCSQGPQSLAVPPCTYKEVEAQATQGPAHILQTWGPVSLTHPTLSPAPPGPLSQAVPSSQPAPWSSHSLQGSSLAASGHLPPIPEVISDATTSSRGHCSPPPPATKGGSPGSGHSPTSQPPTQLPTAGTCLRCTAQRQPSASHQLPRAQYSLLCHPGFPP